VIEKWSWREELNLQPAVYKTAALPLSYASLKVSVCKPIPTLVSENLTTAYEPVKRTRGVTWGLPLSGHSRNQHHRKSSLDYAFFV
jgi:hypothetical protein